MTAYKFKSILIVSGGTGGHIFPAVVFGKWLEKNAGASVTYMSGSRPIEATIYDSAGITPLRLSMEGSPLGVRSPGRILKRTLSLFSAFGETSRYIKNITPDAVFLFGGYVSFAPLLICRKKGIPVIMHEQNAVAGRVTRIASRLGAVITSGWQECDGVKKFTPVGIPTREPIHIEREAALSGLGLHIDANRKIVGVAMGSLGSRPLAEAVTGAASTLAEKNIEIIILGDAADDIAVPVNVHFIGRQWDMNPFYSLCDALVCRAGGSTLAEALRWRIPSVTVPWSAAADGHQERNAKCFAAIGGGAVWHEGGDQSELASAIETQLIRGAGSVETYDPCELLMRCAYESY